MKIAVGLSGGVDSAVTAALLKQQGHEVIGVFMKNWSDDFGLKGDCPWEQDQKDAHAVAEHLGIEFLSYNFELQYRERVIEYFFKEYKAGRTPNPDILCNSEIKFNTFLKKCLQELNVDKIATGHYARVITNDELLRTNAKLGIRNEELRGKSEEFLTEQPVNPLTREPGNISTSKLTNSQTYHLLKGLDSNKDQSYFLCGLTQDELSKAIFPIGSYTKPQVREMANKFRIPVAEKKDSQGICFVGKINVTEFIKSELGSKDGDIVDIDSGKVLGKHHGLWFYTIGQREGLGLGGGPWFVVEKDLSENIIYVAQGSDNPALFRKELELEEINILNVEAFKDVITKSIPVEVMIRYRQKPQRAVIKDFTETTNDSILKVIFDEPQRAVAPGQFGCVYLNSEVIGSGVIR